MVYSIYGYVLLQDKRILMDYLDKCEQVGISGNVSISVEICLLAVGMDADPTKPFKFVGLRPVSAEQKQISKFTPFSIHYQISADHNWCLT